MEHIEVKVKDTLWQIKGIGTGTYEITVNEKVLGFYHDGYPEALRRCRLAQVETSFVGPGPLPSETLE